MKLCSPPLARSLPFRLLPALVLSLALWPGVVTVDGDVFDVEIVDYH